MNIVISGTVGVGKSTISSKLRKHLQSKNEDVFLMEEIQEDNPYLDNYYEDRPSWSFLIQMDFVLDRFNKAYKYSKMDGYKIFDRHFLDDYIIASMPFIKDDMQYALWQSYNYSNKELNNRLKDVAKVDYFFLLKADFDKVISRVNSRGRISEKEVNINYWKDMYDQYYINPEIQTYIKESVKNFVIIDANSDNTDEILEQIIKAIK